MKFGLKTDESIFKNTKDLAISIGDVVAVEGSPGHDVGVVSLSGELVKVQMKKRKVFLMMKTLRKSTEKPLKEILTSGKKQEIKS